MKEHAYLIIAHNEFNTLKKLITLLDYKENDIYLHIDKKVKNFDEEAFSSIVKNASLYFVQRTSVTWGGYSLVNCELVLLKEAIKRKYKYYHLLSGVDLPIKNHYYILEFFRKNEGKEFVGLDRNSCNAKNFYNRIKFYYVFQDVVGRNTDLLSKTLLSCQSLLIKLQREFKVNRMNKYEYKWVKGGQWFSITDDFARYVVSKENEIKKMYKNTICADEIFIQVIAENSQFKDKVQWESLRYTDWERGEPYTFTIEDYDFLIKPNKHNNSKLWARKFSEKKDDEIINSIYNYLLDK